MIRIYLCALCDPVSDPARYRSWIPMLKEHGIEMEISDLAGRQVPAQLKASDFNRAVRSCRYDWIFDLSGGNLGNLVLPYLDYEAYQNGPAVYAAFSDGTCIVNALCARSHRRALLFPIWNQTSPRRLIDIVTTRKVTTTLQGLNTTVPFYRHARIYGGNIRCFLKLAGTPFMPDLTGSFLLLESSSAGWYAFCSMAAHLDQIKAFDHFRGVILGRFNALEAKFGSRQKTVRAIMNLLDGLCGQPLAFYDAPELGHIPNSEGIWIGSGEQFCRDELFELLGDQKQMDDAIHRLQQDDPFHAAGRPTGSARPKEGSRMPIYDGEMASDESR